MSIIKRLCPLLMVLALLAGCGTPGGPRQAEPMGDLDAEVETAVPVVGEEFVFVELPELLRRFGYTGFCPTPEPCDWRLPYGLYKGMQGHFVDEAPIEVRGDTEIYRVRFQTGETYYYYASQRLGGKFAPVAPIVPRALQERVNAFQPEPLVPCSATWVMDARIEFGRLLYQLSNSQTISAEKLSAIRQLSTQFADYGVPLAERLLEVEIRHSLDPYRSAPVTYLEPAGELKANDLRLVLRLSEEGIQPLLRAQYFGDRWIYLRMLEFYADQRLWQRWGLRVHRHEQQGQVREWVELPGGEEVLAIAEALATARQARVRFEGARVYALLKLSRTNQEELRRMLDIYRLLVAALEKPAPPAPISHGLQMCGN